MVKDEISGFPSDFLSPEEKNGKKYALKWAQSTDKVNNNNVFWAGTGNQRIRFDLLRAYARGEQPIDKYKPILGITNKKTKNDPANEAYKVLDWSILDIASKFVNVLVGKIVKRENSIAVRAIDKAAQDAKRAKQIELQEAVINKPLYDAISKVTGIQFQGPETGDVVPAPQTLGEVDVHQEMFYKEDYCIAVQDMLTEINKQDNYEDILMNVARDLTEISIGATKTYRVGNKILRRRCVPERMGMSSSTKDNFEEAKFVFEDWDMTIGQLKEIAGDQFTEEAYMKIAEKVNNSSYSESNVREYYDKNLCYPWDNTKITVRDLIWFSPDWETVEVIQTPLGNGQIVEKDYEWWENMRMNNKMTVDKYNQENLGSRVIRYSLDNQYQCMWIKGTDYVFNYGKSQDMLKNASNLGRTTSPFTIYRIKKSPVETVTTVFDNIQINWLQYQHQIAKSRPSGLDIEFTALQDISLEGAGGKKMTPKEVLKIYFDTGMLLWRRKDALGNNTNFRPIQELQNGLNPAAAQHFTNIVNLIGLLRDMVGLNELTDASTPNSEMGKHVATLAAGSTDDAIRYMNHAFDQINLLTHEKTVMFITGMARTGLAPHYAEAIGLDKVGTLAILSDVTHHELGCYVMKQPDAELRQRLMAYTVEGVKSGQLTNYEAIEIEMEPNVYRAVRLLKMYASQKEKKAREAQMEMYQAEQAKNEASAIATARANSETEVMMLQGKKELEWEKAKAAVWQSKSTTADQAFLIQLQSKLKLGEKLTELEEKRLTDLMTIERQGAIDMQIASMKPKTPAK